MAVKWETFEAIDSASINGETVGNVFLWGGRYASALQGEEMEFHEHKFQAKQAIEAGALKHFAKIYDRAFKPNNQDLETRAKDERQAARAANAQLKF